MFATDSTYRGTYQDNWTEFIRTLRAKHQRSRQEVLAEATTSGEIDIILTGQRHWANHYSSADSRDRARRAHDAAIDAARMTVRNPDAPRQKLHMDSLRTLGPARRHHRTTDEVKADRKEAKTFWKKVTGSRLNVALSDAETHYPAWLVAHPTGDATTAADETAWRELRDQVRPLFGFQHRTTVVKEHLGFVPAGMSQQRALEIAIAAMK